jgi:tetratricopeptide (TPR) repeat protein
VRCILIAAWLITLGSTVYADDSIADQIRSAQSSGNYAEASKLYLQLIGAGNDSPEIRSNCGVMLHLAGKNREALEQFRIALRRKPDSAAANLFAGLSEFDLGDMKAALPYLERAEQLDPGRPAPLLALGKLYLAVRNYRRANELYAKAVALDSQLAEAWYGLGVTDRSLAEEILNHAARHPETKNEATKDQVQHLLDDAVRALTRAVDLDPNSARTHLLMAESLADAGKLVDAVPEYNTAIKLDPEMQAAYLGLASQYWKQHQFGQALPLLRHVLVKSPKDPEANAMMADIFEHNGDTAKAERYAKAALAGNPDLIQTRVVLVRIYLSKQQPALAIAELRQVISADPDGSYHFLLYRACRQAGDQQGASVAIREFQQLRYGASKQ